MLTGGLGPTEDDLTREAIAALLGEPMVVQPDLEAQLRQRFARLSRTMPESNIKQATLIPSARRCPTPSARAPGWWVESAPGRQPAARSQSSWPCPASRRRCGACGSTRSSRGCSRGGRHGHRLPHAEGAGHGRVSRRGQDPPLLASTNPTIGTYAKQDGIHLRLTAKAADKRAALALIEPVEREIRAILGAAVYGVDGETPQGIVCGLLAESGLTVATAEYGTAGALGALLEAPWAPGGCYAGGLALTARPALVALGRWAPAPCR